MVAVPQVVVQHSLRKRLDDMVGLGLLASATLLSFTGLVDLSRDMHPVRFVLVLCTVISLYHVLTKTFVRLRFTDAGVERSSPLRKVHFWAYDQLVEIGNTSGQPLRLQFKDGSLIEIDCSMLNTSDVLPFLQQRANRFTITLA